MIAFCAPRMSSSSANKKRKSAMLISPETFANQRTVSKWIFLCHAPLPVESILAIIAASCSSDTWSPVSRFSSIKTDCKIINYFYADITFCLPKARSASANSSCATKPLPCISVSITTQVRLGHQSLTVCINHFKYKLRDFFSCMICPVCMID